MRANEKIMTTGRKLEYEKIRVCAMLFTIGVHSLEEIPRETVFRNCMYDGLILLFYTCNGIFFMLSGKFALTAECKSVEDYCRFYYKKFVNLVIPMFGYMFLRSLYEAGGVFWKIDFWDTYIRNIFFKYLEGEYWFLYALVGLVLLAPFLNKIVVHLEKSEMWLFIGIGIFCHSVRTYAAYWGLKFPWLYIFGEWTLYFMLGYCLEKIIDTRKKENVVILLGIVCFCISMIQKKYGLIYFIHDLAPTFTIISCGMFFLFFMIPIQKSMIVTILGKYSFAIYMIHNSVSKYITGMISMDGGYLLTLFTLIIITFSASFVIAVVCENIFIRVLKKGFKKVIMMSRMIIKKIVKADRGSRAA